jgi:hypothetical protein
MAKGNARKRTQTGTRNAKSGNSIPLLKKEPQKVKRTLEKHIIRLDGSFVDVASNNGVRSTYTLGKNTEKYTWHITPRSGGIHHTKTDIIKLLTALGATKKQNLEGLSTSALRKHYGLAKRTPLDGELMFPPEFRDLEKALDALLSKTPAEYEADEANEELDRLSRLW